MKSRASLALIAFLLLAAPAHADCPSAPLTSTDDMVVSFVAGQGGTQAAPSTQFASTVKEGMLVYDSTADALKICNGTAWQTLAVGGGGVTAAGTVAGAVQFRSAGGNLAADDTNFVWDDTNDRLYIGNITGTTERLSVAGSIRTSNGGLINGNGNTTIATQGTGSTILAAGSNQLVVTSNSGTPASVISTTTASVGIGVATPNTSALLDVSSTTKGFLPPRMTTAQVTAVASPADGLIVYDTDTDTIKLRANGAWISLLGGSGSESDPQVGTLTGTKWCAANAGGTAIDCTADAPATGAAGAGSEVQFRNSSTGAFAANANFVWDNTNTRLGIGTASPGFAPVAGRSYLTIAGPSNAGVLEFLTNQADADGNGVGLIQFSDKNTTATTEKRVSAIMGALDGATANLRGGSLRFYTRPDNSDTALAERMRITGAGNVGIGTNNPTALLTVDGDNGQWQAFFGDTTSAARAGIWSGDVASVKRAVFGTPDASTAVALNTGGTDRLWIKATGEVGIGTTDPQAVTHIASSNGQMFRLQNTGASGGIWDLKVGGGGWSNGQFHITERTGALDAARVLVMPGGNVGIGDTNPQSRLSVIGPAAKDSTFELQTTANGKWLAVNADTTPGSWSPLHLDGDTQMIFSGGTINTGALTIAQWSGSPRGIRIAADGKVWMSEICDETGANCKDISTGWSGGGGTPGGSTTQVQFNSAGAFAGDSGFVWDNTNKYADVSNSTWGGYIARSYNAGASGGASGGLVFVRGRGTQGSPTPPQAGDLLGLVAYRSYAETRAFSA